MEPSLTPVEKTATLHDLIRARSGVYHPALYETESMKAKRPLRGSHAPDTFWYYNNWDFNTLGTVYEKAVGQSIFEAFDQKIAKPLQMQDYTPADGSYFRGEDSQYPAYPINMTARDLARFALLFLREGHWKGRQIVPTPWVKESTKPWSANSSGGYGYLWWTADSPTGPGPLPLPRGTFWAEGAGGQFAMVIPALDLVVINRVDTEQTTQTVSRKDMAQLAEQIIQALGPVKSGS